MCELTGRIEFIGKFKIENNKHLESFIETFIYSDCSLVVAEFTVVFLKDKPDDFKITLKPDDLNAVGIIRNALSEGELRNWAGCFKEIKKDA